MQVVPEIVDVLQAHREAQQPVTDADGVAGVLVDDPMGQRGRVLDQRVDGAEADSRRDQLEPAQQRVRVGPAAADSEGDQRARAQQLRAVRDRVVDGRDRGVRS